MMLRLTNLLKRTLCFLLALIVMPGLFSTFSSVKANESQFHRVERGETLTEIAHTYNTTVPALASLNNLQDADAIREGQLLLVSVEEVAYQTHLVKSGDTFWELAKEYDVTLDALLKANPRVEPNRLLVGAELIVPVRSDKGTARFLQPANGRLSSPFGPRWGRMHEGIDLAGAVGTPVVAADGGIVEFAGWQGSFGRLVIIRHSAGFQTYYAHLSKTLAEEGQQVSAGQVIGELGDSGRTTGPNLHFEVHLNGQPVNPLQFIKGM